MLWLYVTTDQVGTNGKYLSFHKCVLVPCEFQSLLVKFCTNGRNLIIQIINQFDVPTLVFFYWPDHM